MNRSVRIWRETSYLPKITFFIGEHEISVILTCSVIGWHKLSYSKITRSVQGNPKLQSWLATPRPRPAAPAARAAWARAAAKPPRPGREAPAACRPWAARPGRPARRRRTPRRGGSRSKARGMSRSPGASCAAARAPSTDDSSTTSGRRGQALNLH